MIKIIKEKFKRLFRKEKTGFYTYCEYEKEIVSRVININEIKYRDV